MPAQAAASLGARRRLLDALACKPVDRVPVWMMRQAGRYLPEYQAVRANYDFLDLCKTPAAAAEVSLQPLEILGVDAVIIFNDILIPLEHAGAEVRFDDRGPSILNPLRDAKSAAAIRDTLPGPGEPVAETIREARRRAGEDVPILGFIGAPWTLATYWIEGGATRDFAHILRMRWAEPELLDRILESITRAAAAYLRVQIDAGADAVQIFDTWGSTLGAGDYERFSGRWIRSIIESVRGLGVPVIVYVNGCAPYLGTLGTLGANCVSVDWRTELATARRVLGPGVALQGNLDPLALYAPPDKVEEAVRELFAKFPPGPGHVFNLGHGILRKTPVESAKRLVEAVKRHGACK